MRILSCFLALLAASVLPARADLPFDTRAEFAVIMDGETGTIFYSKNGEKLMKPASMTKLMTIAILFDHIKTGKLTLEDTFPVSEKAWREREGSSMFVRVNTEVTIEDLIRGIVVASGNDACIVVAEGISGTEDEFSYLMTEFGRKTVGLKKSTFGNSHGMPHPDTWMTAEDLAILAKFIIDNYPDLYEYFSEKEFQYGEVKNAQPNRNPLLYANIGSDGLKTGHTQESGYGLTASAVQRGYRMIVVVNGLASESERATESQRLVRKAFRDFERYELFKAGDPVGEANVWMGQSKTVPVTVQEDLIAILRPEDREEMEVSVEYTGPIPAPISAGDKVAELHVRAPNSPTLVRDLYASEAVGELGLVGRMGATLMHMITNSLSPAEEGAAANAG